MTGAIGTNEATLHCRTLDPTTSFLTAAALIYAIGAVITAGAGTRLAHQLILTDLFSLSSMAFFTWQGRMELLFFLRRLSELLLGNLRACCQP